MLPVDPPDQIGFWGYESDASSPSGPRTTCDAGEEDDPQWREVAETFAYDCEDEADDWWVQWGVLRERARGSEDGSDAEEPGAAVRRRASTQPLLDFSKAMSAVETAVSF